MSKKFKIYSASTFSLKGYEGKYVKSFFGGYSIEIYIDGSWHYIVAYLKKDSYHPIKEVLGNGLNGLISQTIFYHKKKLDKKYINNLNDFKKVYDKLVDDPNNKRLGKNKVEEMALKKLKLKERELKSLRVTKIELI